MTRKTTSVKSLLTDCIVSIDFYRFIMELAGIKLASLKSLRQCLTIQPSPTPLQSV